VFKLELKLTRAAHCAIDVAVVVLDTFEIAFQ
jgi:hypothetical protein